MQACVRSCGSDRSDKCAEKIKEFECKKKKDYSESMNDLENSCPIGNPYRYRY
jgi:hypothetical protein